MNSGKKGNILIVDDTPANIQLLAEMLKAQGYQVRPTNSGKRALEAARSYPPDLILLDVNMPDLDGYESCRLLKAVPTLKDIPVIFLSAADSISSKVQGFEAGGVDYITKPFQIQEVLARVKTHLELAKQRREIEALRQSEAEQFRRLNQLKDELLRVATHDLKAPMSIILGFLDLLESDLKTRQVLTAENNEYLEYIRENAQNGLKLMRDLLELARTEGQLDLNLGKVSLAGYLQKLVKETYALAAPQNIELVFNAGEEDLTAQLSATRFGQALTNLLTNAIKYSNIGGYVEVKLEKADNHALIKVIDKGIGIPPEALPFLFDKFYRVPEKEHQERHGSGLGLAIVKTIVEQHNGKIEVQSVPGQGSIFTISLPLAP